MNNGYERVPEYIAPSFGNVKADAKYYLSKKNVRRIILMGAVISAMAIAVPVLICELFVYMMSNIEWTYLIAFQNVMVFMSVCLGLFLLFPGVYCGMYRVLLKAAAGAEPNISDLWFFYTSGKLFLRSIGIFFGGAWYLLGIFVYLSITQVIAAILGAMQNEAFAVQLQSFVVSLFAFYFIFGTLLMVVNRKKLFIFIPYAVENISVPLSKAKSISRQMRSTAYVSSLSGDLLYTIIMILLSLLSIGILFVVYTGPMMMSRKVSFYKTNMFNKFNLYG